MRTRGIRVHAHAPAYRFRHAARACVCTESPSACADVLAESLYGSAAARPIINRGRSAAAQQHQPGRRAADPSSIPAAAQPRST